MSGNGSITTGQLAEQGEVNVETVRFYERQGLLPKPPRKSSGYRAYPPDAVIQVRFIKQSQELGFTLKEVKELLALRAHPENACDSVRRQAEEKIADIDKKMKMLHLIRRELDALTRACAGPHDPRECPILKCLDARGRNASVRARRRR